MNHSTENPSVRNGWARSSTGSRQRPIWFSSQISIYFHFAVQWGLSSPKDTALARINCFIVKSSYIFNMKAADFSLSFKPFRSILNGFRSKILKGQNSNQVRQRKLLLKKNTNVMVHLCKMLVRTSIFQNYTFRSEINFDIRCWWHRKIL